MGSERMGLLGEVVRLTSETVRSASTSCRCSSSASSFSWAWVAGGASRLVAAKLSSRRSAVACDSSSLQISQACSVRKTVSPSLWLISRSPTAWPSAPRCTRQDSSVSRCMKCRDAPSVTVTPRGCARTAVR